MVLVNLCFQMRKTVLQSLSAIWERALKSVCQPNPWTKKFKVHQKGHQIISLSRAPHYEPAQGTDMSQASPGCVHITKEATATLLTAVLHVSSSVPSL